MILSIAVVLIASVFAISLFETRGLDLTMDNIFRWFSANPSANPSTNSCEGSVPSDGF